MWSGLEAGRCIRRCVGGVQSSIGVIDGGVSREVMGYMGYLECIGEKKFKVLLEEWRSGRVKEVVF